MSDALRTAAQAVLDRWNSPKWEWSKQGPTADLMQALHDELAQPQAPSVPADVFATMADLGQQINKLAANERALIDEIVRLRSAATAPVGLDANAALIDELRGLDTPQRVRFYEHDFYVLSNFSAFSVLWGGFRYPTSEHLYHVEKFRNFRGDVADLIANAPSAHEAFKIAERHRADRRPDWDEIKVAVMREILSAKAAQHEYVRRKLLATGDRELVEDSWRDDFWGWGPDRKGQNMLGRLWMEVRAELRAAVPQAQAAPLAQPEPKP